MSRRFHNTYNLPRSKAEKDESSRSYWTWRLEQDAVRKCSKCKRHKVNTDLMSLCELEVFNREKLCVFCQHAPSARELLALPDWVNPLITYDVVSKPRFTQQQMNSAITAKMLSNPRSLASMRKAQMKQGMRDVAAAHRKTERTAAVAAVAAAASAAKEKRRARTADDDDDDDDYEEDDCSLDEADAEELEEIDFINEVDEDEREIFDIDEENAVDAHDMALDED